MSDPGCGYCEAVLEAHCEVYRHGEEFCDLRERYYSDPAFTSEDVFRALIQTSTPEQAREAVEWAKRKVSQEAG